jgi:hypothetical protein
LHYWSAMKWNVSRTVVNFFTDVLLLLLFLMFCTLSVVLEFVFPVGTQAEGWTLWNLTFGEWSRVRFILLAAFAAVILLHVMLHWSWVCGVVESRLGRKKKGGAAHDDPSRTLWGVGLLIVVVNVIGFVVAAASLAIQSPVATP